MEYFIHVVYTGTVYYDMGYLVNAYMGDSTSWWMRA